MIIDKISRTPLQIYFSKEKKDLWHFPISPGRTAITDDIHYGNHRRRRRRSLQLPSPPPAPHSPLPPVLRFLLLRHAARRRGGLRLGRCSPRRRRRRARRRVRPIRVLPEGRHLQPGNGEFLSCSHACSRNCMRMLCEGLICGCADLRGDFTGQKGGVREVLGGGSSRGIHPQGVSVISTLKLCIPISSQKKYFCPCFLFESGYVI